MVEEWRSGKGYSSPDRVNQSDFPRGTWETEEVEMWNSGGAERVIHLQTRVIQSDVPRGTWETEEVERWNCGGAERVIHLQTPGYLI